MMKFPCIIALALCATITSCGGSGAKTEVAAPAPLSEICDSAKLAEHVAAHPERWNAAYKYISEAVSDGVEPGTYEVLPGGEVFAIVSEYEPRPADSCRFEAHRKYIDLQYLVSGTEMMGVTSPEGLEVIVPYTDDIEFYSPDGVDARYAKADSTTYFTFFPDDPHRPSIRPDESDSCPKVKKIVVKILY